jgi:hypothetical protein
MRALPPVPSPGDGAGSGRQGRAAGLAAGLPRTPYVARGDALSLCGRTNGPRLPFKANLLPFPAFRRRPREAR